MARRAMGMAIAPDVRMMREDLARGPDDATSAATNDRQSGVILIEGRIGGVLAAEYRALIRYSRRLTGNGQEAADLVHIVVTRVLSQPTPIAAVGNPSGWLRTVLFHTFIDLRRRARWEIPTDSAALDRRSAAPEDEPTPPPITVDEVRALLATLPAHYRVPYELFTFESMPYARIATVLGISCTTVGTRINRARNRLRSLIRADGER
jgi:RNA polymerase sigma-70 factor (ECF subfamily)